MKIPLFNLKNPDNYINENKFYDNQDDNSVTEDDSDDSDNSEKGNDDSEDDNLYQPLLSTKNDHKTNQLINKAFQKKPPQKSINI